MIHFLFEIQVVYSQLLFLKGLMGIEAVHVILKTRN